MNIITLDFSNCTDIQQIHDVLQKGLGFPEDYSRKWVDLQAYLEAFCNPSMTIRLRGLSRWPEQHLMARAVMLEAFDEASYEHRGMLVEVHP